MKRISLVAAMLGLSILGTQTGCHISFHSMDGYSFNYKGETAERSEQEALPEEIKSLNIDNRFGSVQVIKSDSQFNYSWNVKCWAKTADDASAFTKMVHLKPENSGDTFTLTVELPEPDSKLRGVVSTLIVNVPENINVSVENTFGPADVDGVLGEVAVGNRHGNTKTKNCAGNVEINGRHGDITCQNVGSATINAAHADVEVAAVAGDLRIENSHGHTKIQKINGDVTFSGSHSSLDAAEITGQVKFKTSHDNIRLHDIAGHCEIDVRHGDISAKNMVGNLDVDVDHGELNYVGESQTVKVSGDHSDVYVTLNNTDIKSVNIRASFDDVRLTLPKAADVAFDLDADFGDVNAPQGDLAGKGKVRIRTNHGDIDVIQSSATAP